ncbi:MAG: hypothetical protein KME28_01840 [Pelatocladus maniniholoensis HA4357-MV3]|uniref:Uncharacterized protein n=1 Tax=Pelatocladus maniniholoensis HA4357-MV3 TaxID=1117104 RepID=A0A9E3H4L5_9NOST|nr:hypothetical protein [Pelatocladus maniniholoensis HA4357-MV3]
MILFSISLIAIAWLARGLASRTSQFQPDGKRLELGAYTKRVQVMILSRGFSW